MATEAAPPPVMANDVQQQPAQPTTPPPLTYLDFVPMPLTQGGMFTMAQYERFDVLLQRANEWLSANPVYTVLTCESAEAKSYPGMPNKLTNDDAWYSESGKHATFYIRFLRLWLRLRGPGDRPGPSQVGYLNVIPGCIDQGGTFSLPKFEDFGTTVNRINEMFRANPLPGKIINVETQDIKFESYNGSLDPDGSFWMESGRRSTYLLNMIRVFYEMGPPANEQIGCVDFVPSRTSQGGMLTMGSFESFGNVVGQAHNWMKQNAGMNVVNMQSIDYKLYENFGGETLNTQRTLFRESGKYRTYYVRILRVYYTTGGPSRAQPFNLTYRTFVPCQFVSANWASPGVFETLSQTVQRAQAWLRLTGVKPVSAETVPVKVYLGAAGGSAIEGSERTFTANSGRYVEVYMFVIRIYFDGFYQEPAPELLPPIPQMQISSAPCCNIL